MELQHLLPALSSFCFPSSNVCGNKNFPQGAVNLNLCLFCHWVLFFLMESCSWFTCKEWCCLFQLERMGGIAVSLLPPDSCRWSRYPFDLPFQSSWDNALGLLSEVGKFVFLDVSEVLIWMNSWFWKLFHCHALSLFFAGMKCALFH